MKQYKKHFLKKVIIRIDFISEVMQLVKNEPASIRKKLLSEFPIAEPKKTITKELQISPKHQVKETQTEGKQWFYHSKNREKTACLSRTFFYVEYNKYKSFEKLKKDFIPILHTLYEIDQNISISRFGLRYINHIELKEPKTFDWKEYLSPKLLGSFKLFKNGGKIIRAFNNFTSSDGNMILQFRYGMHNPDFPAPIKRKLYILDLDAYCQGSLEGADIEEYIDKFHEEIKKLFESVITDKLRKKMGVTQNGK